MPSINISLDQNKPILAACSVAATVTSWGCHGSSINNASIGVTSPPIPGNGGVWGGEEKWEDFQKRYNISKTITSKEEYEALLPPIKKTTPEYILSLPHH